MSDTFLTKVVGNIHLMFTAKGDLVDVNVYDGSQEAGRYYTITGRQFLNLADVVLQFAKQRQEIAEKEKAVEEARLAAEGKVAHEFQYDGGAGSLAERCLKCGYVFTVVAKMAVERGHADKESLVQHCPGSEEALQALLKARADAQSASLQEQLSKLIQEAPPES